VKRILGIVLALVLSALIVGCGGGDAAQPSPTFTVAEPPATTSTTSGVASTESPGQPEQPASSPSGDLSGDSLEYARSLGGVSRQGETLFLVVGAGVATEGEAKVLLQQATPFFGDMVSYFIVQKSDNFEGLSPGDWVVFEAYDANPSAENLDFGRRGFPNAYVARVKVLTTDPIPVYEDRLGL
jgi:hypothetical protein